MIYNNKIFDKYFAEISPRFCRPLTQITELTIHGTAGGYSAQALLSWMEQSEREKEYRQGIGLFHYEIDFDGTIYQIIPDEYFVYHSSSGGHDRATVGIELMNSQKDNASPYTIDQYNSLFTLIKYEITRCPIGVIAGHGATGLKYSKKYKNCPGQFFDWQLLENNFSVVKEAEEIYKLV